jgi:hypothetical protein
VAGALAGEQGLNGGELGPIAVDRRRFTHPDAPADKRRP